MRKSLSIVLLFLFLLNLGGYNLWYYCFQQIIQCEIKEQIRAGIKESELSLIITPIDNEKILRWIKPGKEFFYKGKMYDVVKVNVKDEKNYFYCINDTRENELIAHWMKDSRKRKETERLVKRVINNTFMSPHSRMINQVYASDIDYPVIQFNLETGNPEIPSPPPKYI